jgi:hypothetical protein
MSINTKIRSVAAVAVVAGLSLAGVASAATVQRTGGPIAKPVVAGSTNVAIYAFPTGGTGSGSETTCSLYDLALAADHRELDNAVKNNSLSGYQNAKAMLDDDTNEALNAGCVVID